jgi:hypothetical protein
MVLSIMSAVFVPIVCFVVEVLKVGLTLMS